MPAQDPPDPTAQDEDEAIRLQQLVESVDLTSTRTDDGPPCASCRHYLNPDEAVAYCWHPDLRVLVDAAWTCRHHAPAHEDR